MGKELPYAPWHISNYPSCTQAVGVCDLAFKEPPCMQPGTQGVCAPLAVHGVADVPHANVVVGCRSTMSLWAAHLGLLACKVRTSAARPPGEGGPCRQHREKSDSGEKYGRTMLQCCPINLGSKLIFYYSH